VKRPTSRLQRILRSGSFGVTAEVVPPRSADRGAVVGQARALVGYADAVNVTDNPTGSIHMTPLAGCAMVAEAGLEPVVQLTCRDRNRLGLTSDLLGAWALGARNVLCLSGDPTPLGDHPGAKGVFDLDVMELVRLAATLRSEGRTPDGDDLRPAPRFYVGVAELPLAAGNDPARLERKADAGAEFVQTQIVYDVDAFGAWAESIRPRGLFERMQVLAGVAPPRSAASARFMRDHLPGVVVPDDVIARLEDAGPDHAEDAGVELTVDVVRRLREVPGVAGVHAMGLGREHAVRRVIADAGLLPRPVGG
jgi:methylenetetrahydrofolate reductase (NADPH)